MKRLYFVPLMLLAVTSLSSCNVVKRVINNLTVKDLSIYEQIDGLAYKDVDLNTGTLMREYTYEKILDIGHELLDSEETGSDLGMAVDHDGNPVYKNFHKKTFYVKNITKTIRDYKFSFTFKKRGESQKLIDTMRAMIYVNSYTYNPNEHQYYVWAAPSNSSSIVDGEVTDRELISTPEYGYANNFVDDKTLATYNIIIEPQEIYRFTFVFWIEGYDPDGQDRAAPASGVISLYFKHSSKEY